MKAAADALTAHLDVATAKCIYYNICIDQSKFSIPASVPSIPQQFNIWFSAATWSALSYLPSRPNILQLYILCNVLVFVKNQPIASIIICFMSHNALARMEKSYGSNAVLSMLHTHLSRYAISWKLCFHANNYVGKNKNHTVVAYMLWRCMCGFSDEVELNFMRVGHTRCATDWYFGALKKKFRSLDVDSIDDVEVVVNSSSKANHDVMFGWEWRDWPAFMDTMFKPVKGIGTHQHYGSSKDSPGTVFVRAEPTSAKTAVQLLKQNATVTPDFACSPTQGRLECC